MIERVYGEIWKQPYPSSGGRPWRVMGEDGEVYFENQGEAMEYSATLNTVRIKWAFVGAICKIIKRYGFNENDYPKEIYIRWTALNEQLYPMLTDEEKAVHRVYGMPGLRDGKTVTCTDGAAARAVAHIESWKESLAIRMEGYQTQTERLLARIREKAQEPDDNVFRFFVLNDLKNIIGQLEQLDRDRRDAVQDNDLLDDILAKLE